MRHVQCISALIASLALLAGSAAPANLVHVQVMQNGRPARGATVHFAAHGGREHVRTKRANSAGRANFQTLDTRFTVHAVANGHHGMTSGAMSGNGQASVTVSLRGGRMYLGAGFARPRLGTRFVHPRALHHRLVRIARRAIIKRK